MTAQFATEADYTAAVDRCTRGLTFVSVGASAQCSECGDDGDSANEGFFSWQACDLCGSTLGGQRYPCHAIMDAEMKPWHGELWHGACCVDCLLYFANGDLPEHLRP